MQGEQSIITMLRLFNTVTQDNASENLSVERKITPYFDMVASGIYHFKYEVILENNINIVEYYHKNGMVAIISQTGTKSGRMVSRDGKLYHVNDSEKTYWITYISVSYSSALEAEKMLYIGNGTAEFYGELLFYEDESKHVSRFFFKGDLWVGIQHLSEEFLDIINIEMDQNVLDYIFDIRNDYLEKEASDFR